MPAGQWPDRGQPATRGGNHLASARTTGWALADQVVVSGVNFLTGILIARMLGIEAFGAFALLWMVVQFAASIQHALIVSPMMSIGPQQTEFDGAVYFGAALAHQVAFAALVAGLVYCGVRVADPFIGHCCASLAWPLACATATAQMQEFARRYFFAVGRAPLAFADDAIAYLGRLAALAVVFGTLAADLEVVLWIHAGASAAAALVGIAGFGRVRWRAEAVVAVARRHWASARWLLASAALQWTSGNLFPLAIGAMLGLASLGAMRAAQNLFGLTHILLQGLDNSVPGAAAVRLRDGGMGALRSYLAKVGGACAALAVAFGLVAAALPGFWLDLFYGAGFASYGDLLRWYAAIYVFTFAIFPLRVGLRTIEHTRPLFWAYVVATAFTAAALVPLISAMGLTGAMAGLLANQMLMFAVLLGSLHRHGRRLETASPSPRGLVVAFLGPDGSGKSTVIDRFRDAAAGRFEGARVLHLAPRLARRRASAPIHAPHARPPYGALLSVLKIVYFAADYWLGYWCVVQPALRRGQLVIFDRYCHDLLVDPARYRYGGPKRLAERLARLVPQPDLWVFLDAPVDVLRSRKQEVAVAESPRQRQAYRSLAESLPDALYVDTDRPLADVVEELVGQIASRTRRARSGSHRPSRRDEGMALAGIAGLPECVFRDLEEAGPGRAISDVRTGRWSKVLGRVADAEGNRFWLKAATHAYGRELLRREARGHRELAPLLAGHFRTPRLCVLRDEGDVTALLLSEVAGTRRRVWQFPEQTVTMLADDRIETNFGTWARSIVDPLVPGTVRERLGSIVAGPLRTRPLVLGPSHGDFAAWNLLDDGSPRPALLDFEYYAPARPLFFDDLHWWVGFVARRAVGAGMRALPRAWVRRLPTMVWNAVLQDRYGRDAPPCVRHADDLAVYLAAFLVAQCARYAHEHAIPDAEALTGRRDHRLRAKITTFYLAALEALGR